MRRLICGKVTYNVKELNKMTDGEMASAQESNTPAAPEGETQIQDSAEGTLLN